ncbi:MAG: ATP-binding protein [Candidatus Lokiarchaeota archaeon]|nr:ATP-binding protein [Candidatus Lokiarchaeota archaeon]
MISDIHDENELIGVFLGMSSSAYEYMANIITPYQHGYVPLIGEFLVIENGAEYIVARITEVAPRGEFTTFMGEKWLADVALYEDAIGQDIKSQKITYLVRIKLLGRINRESNKFVPGVRSVPHITSKVRRPSRALVKEICNKALEEQQAGVQIGTYTLDPAIDIRFDFEHLVSRRTFIFSRAGYGKSNLMKVIASSWTKDHGALFIFDPEGEYAITDKKGRPGIMDRIPAILITNRKNIAAKVGRNVYNRVKFDLKAFKPKFIVPIIVPESKHEYVFFRKLMSLEDGQWRELVDLIHDKGWNAEGAEITRILKKQPRSTAEEEDMAMQRGVKEDVTLMAIINNLVAPIRSLHDPESRIINVLEEAARKELPVILDISLLDSVTALQFCSIIIAHFFNKNQRDFVGGDENLLKIVFAIEEAQSVIGSNQNVQKFVELAKEGRKYQLGSIFITQQPASISPEIISQGDNFFVFHMLSKGDLRSLQSANAHYSDDILTQVLNEPVRGKAYFWSSPQPFVIPVQIADFEQATKPGTASTIQSTCDLLKDVEATISAEDSLEAGIIGKLGAMMREKGIDAGNAAMIEQKKKELTIGLYRALTEAERAFIKKIGAGQVGPRGPDPFAITFLYFTRLVEKLKTTSRPQ